MKRSSTYMEKYEYFQENYCRNGVRDTKRLESCLEPEMIIQGRYIIGDVQRVNYNSGTIVYICLDMLFDRVVLIQELFLFKHCIRRKDGIVMPDDGEAVYFKQCVSSYVENGKKLIRLYKEPDILTVYSSFEENNTGYIASEYQNKDTSLKLILSKNNAMDPEQSIENLKLILTALEKIHKQGIIFSRLELENIYVCSDYSIKLLCFGNTDMYNLVSSCSENEGEPITVKMAAYLFFKMITGHNFDLDPAIDKKLKPYKSVIIDALSAKDKTQIKTAAEFIRQISLIEQKTAQNAGKKNRKQRNWLLCLLLVFTVITISGVVYTLSVYRQKGLMSDTESIITDAAEVIQPDKVLKQFKIFLSESMATPAEIKPVVAESKERKRAAQPHEASDSVN